ncbi:type VI secretion system Vgr family protein [Sphingomonas sp. MMS24-JH45]
MLIQTEYLRESLLGYHYRLTLAPWTHFIAHNSAYRIHQDLSALDIIKKIFADAGLSDVEYKSLTRAYPPRTYCVQYGESDFAFVSRLMEEEGIYYYFRHEAERHVMVLCDGPNSHPQSALSKLEYNTDPVGIHLFDQALAGRLRLSDEAPRVHAHPGETQVVLRDFDLAKPGRPVQATWTESAEHQSDAAEVFEYPGHFTEEARGAELGVILLARRRDRRTYHGDATTSQLSVGGLIAVLEPPDRPLQRAISCHRDASRRHVDRGRGRGP